MTNHDLLKSLIGDIRGGDPLRISKLFETNEVFLQLRAAGQDSDWYHFEPKTYDGCYLVQDGSHFLVYQQDRGSKIDLYSFSTLRAAAERFFSEYW
jgi:hypothetical protein